MGTLFGQSWKNGWVCGLPLEPLFFCLDSILRTDWFSAKCFAASPPRVTLDIMPDRIGLLALSRRHAVVTGALMLMLSAEVAWPQSAPPPSSQPSSQPSSPGPQAPAPQAPGGPAPPQSEPAPPPPSPEENPGLLNEMGKLFEKSLSILPTIKSPGEA